MSIICQVLGRKRIIRKGDRIHIKGGLIWVKEIQIRLDPNALEPVQTWVVIQYKRTGKSKYEMGLDIGGFVHLVETGQNNR